MIFFFIIRYLYLNINEVSFSEIEFNLLYLAISIIIYITHILINATIWFLITKQNSCDLSYFESIKIRIFSDFGKYIPGKIFAYGILFYSYDQKAISKKKIIICSFQELITGTVAAIIIAFVSVYFSEIEILEKYNLIFIGLAFICLIIIHPRILGYLSNRILKIFKREPIEIPGNYGQVIFILFLFIISWLVFGMGFYFFINSFYSYSISYFLFTTGAFAVAGLIGFIALFAPAGLGVREGVLVFILSYIFPAAISAVVAIISRLWMTVCELILFLAVFLIYSTNNLLKKKHNVK